MALKGPGKGADLAVFRSAGLGLAEGKPPSWFVEIASRSRGATIAVASVLDTEEGRAIRENLAQACGEDPGRPARLLLRRAQGRDGPAQELGTPIARNEGFDCAGCGAVVPPAPGTAVRNHCPRCLRSQHVDGPVPGDRASDCGGLMDPSDLAFQGGEWRATFRCRTCGFERRNRLYPDWREEPDRIDVIASLRPA